MTIHQSLLEKAISLGLDEETAEKLTFGELLEFVRKETGEKR